MNRYVSGCNRPVSRQKTEKGNPIPVAMCTSTTSSDPLNAMPSELPHRSRPHRRTSAGGRSASSTDMRSSSSSERVAPAEPTGSEIELRCSRTSLRTLSTTVVPEDPSRTTKNGAASTPSCVASRAPGDAGSPSSAHWTSSMRSQRPRLRRRSSAWTHFRHVWPFARRFFTIVTCMAAKSIVTPSRRSPLLARYGLGVPS